MTKLTAERLRELLHYDPETGVFTRIKRTCTRIPVGSVAGATHRKVNGKLYRIIKVDGVAYKAHRLAYLWMTGEWPAALIGHRDDDGLNNAWGNIRPATQAENAKNCRRYKTSTSGFKGVSLHKKTGKWVASITVDKQRHHLGLFLSPQHAYAAYCAASRRLHGEFGRTE